jgi:hypothetical protein
MKHTSAILAAMTLATMARADTLAERLWAAYDPVQSVSAELRRETRAEGGNTLRMLSRVHWRRGDRLHAETVTPIRRRVVADGMKLFSYMEGDPLGFARPIEQLDPDWRISLRKIPATPTEYLLRLQGVAETERPATSEHPVRRGYDTGRVHAVLCLDRDGRLACVETYADAEANEPIAVHRFEQWEERAGAWFSRRQHMETRVDGQRLRETVQVLRLEVNVAMPDLLFQPGRFFKDVRFTDDLRRIYPPGETER